MTVKTGAPKIKPAVAAWQIRREIEPTAVRRDGRVCIRRERVARDFEQLRFSPCGVSTCGRPYLSHARPLRISAANGKVHRLAVGRKRASPFVKSRVEFALYGFRTLPDALLVFLRPVDVPGHHAGNVALFIARHLGAGRREIKAVRSISRQRGAIIRTVGVEELRLLDGVSRSGLFHTGRQPGCIDTR